MSNITIKKSLVSFIQSPSFGLLAASGFGAEILPDLAKLSIEDLTDIKIESVSKFEQRVIEAPAPVSIVRRFVELMGGSIGLHSVAAKGSTFAVTLPVNHEEQRLGAEL